MLIWNAYKSTKKCILTFKQVFPYLGIPDFTPHTIIQLYTTLKKKVKK